MILYPILTGSMHSYKTVSMRWDHMCPVDRGTCKGFYHTITGFYKWGMDFSLGIGAGRIKIFVSTPTLQNIVPFLHLLVATDNCYMPYKFGV